MAFYNANMTHKTTIDRAGRIVIPKPLRDNFRLAPGDTVEIDSSGEEITLRPARVPVALVKEEGIWVYRAGLGDTVLRDLIDHARQERIGELMDDLGGPYDSGGSGR